MNGNDRRIALFDVCNTIASVSTLDDFVEHFLLSPGRNLRGGRAIGVERAAMKALQFLRRFRLIRGAWYKQYLLSRFRGYSAADLAPLAQRYVDERLTRLLKREIVGRLEKFRAEGFAVYLVSGALDVYLKPLADLLGAGLISTELEQDGKGRYTGRIAGEECSGPNKVVRVKAIFAAEEINWNESVAFGDSFLDVPMLSLVGKAFVVDPDPRLEQIARQKGWQIIRTGG
jgi:HAD superfamily hydrolase (TIGR01490 family)